MDPDTDVLRLRIPAADAYLATSRLFGAAAARQLGASGEVVEDLRLAVSEACTIALREARTPTAIQLTIRSSSSGIAAEMRAQTDGSNDGNLEALAEDAAPEDAWGVDVLRAMVSSLAIARDGEGQVTVSFGCDEDREGPDDRAAAGNDPEG